VEGLVEREGGNRYMCDESDIRMWVEAREGERGKASTTAFLSFRGGAAKTKKESSDEDQRAISLMQQRERMGLLGLANRESV
jgi:hypothetical protein